MEPTKSVTDPFVGTGQIQTGQVLFGRDREIELLTDLLISRRIVLLHSPSGAGKSSLINAGLIPAMISENFQVLPVIHVKSEVPQEVLAVAAEKQINRYRISTLLSLEGDPTLSTRLSSPELGSMSLANYLETRRAQGIANQPILLIFDQFEEILTTNPIDLDVKLAFFQDVGQALSDRRCWALFAMREDFIGGLDPYLQYLPTQLSARVRLDLLTKEAAAQAIQRPAPEGQDGKGVFNTFTEGAAQLLADDLRTMLVQEESGKRVQQPGPYVEPVQLQVVCKRLWEKRGSADKVDESTLSSAGTVNEALAGYFADSVKQIADSLKDSGVREWMIRNWFDRKLITSGGIRGQVMMGENETEGLDNRAVRLLIDQYLVREERRRGITWYELAHDRLVDPIRQDNEQWRRLNLSRYQNRAVRYVNEGQPPELLLTAAELKEMEQWESQHQGDLTYEEEDLLEASRTKLNERQKQQAHVDLGDDLSVAGWGVIFSESADPELRENLTELLNLRALQARGRFKVFTYRCSPPESAAQFLARYGAVPVLVDPAVIPYYLLIVGSPADIPLDFQYQLDLNYAVGRLWFDDPEELRTYARGVVMAESGQVKLARRMALFSPSHAGDAATRMVVENLAPAMMQRIRAAGLDPAWNLAEITGEAATRERLGRLLGGEESPALLALFSHGLPASGPDDDLEIMGALVTADWRGAPQPWHSEPGYYFAGRDLNPEANLIGMIALISAAYSAGGVPGKDDFAFRSYGTRKAAPQEGKPAADAVLAHLPQRLLGNPGGGALAVIAHIDRPWLLEGGTGEAPVFSELLRRLMQGSSVGDAMTVMNERYAYYTSRLSDLMHQQMLAAESGTTARSSSSEQTVLMTGLIDARNYIILGDPAVRLPLADPAQDAVRPALSAMDVTVGLESMVSYAQEAAKSPVSRSAEPTPMPAQIIYPDLEIELLAQNGGYFLQQRVSSPESTTGEGPLLPISLDPDALAALESDPAAYSRALSQALFGSEEINTIFFQAQSMAQSQGLPLRIRLRILPTALEKLQPLHWELLPEPRGDRNLAAIEDVLFSRYVIPADGKGHARLRPRPAGPLRILAASYPMPESVVAAVVSDLLPASEQRMTKAAPQPAPYEVLTSSPADLVKKLAQEVVDILYMAIPVMRLSEGEVVAGGFDTTALIDTMKSLKELPRLVVLVSTGPRQSRESGRPVSDSTLLLAQRLADEGIPAILAIPSGASADTILIFLRTFFSELARDGMADRAAGAARRDALLLNQPDWWKPVLFTLLRSAMIWSQFAVETEGQAPFLAPPTPPDFIERPDELNNLVNRLIQPHEATGQAPLVLVGPPGSGKTALLASACAHENVKAYFSGGILWLNLGASSAPAARLCDTLTGVLTGEPPLSTSLDEARRRFILAAGGKRLLLVLDDAQDRESVTPFLYSLPGVTLVVTSLRRSLLPYPAQLMEIGPLSPPEAARLLAARVPGADTISAELAILADRLGRWPAALRQAADVLKQRVEGVNQSPADALAYLARSLERPGQDVLGLKPVMTPTLNEISPQATLRYAELSIFPTGEDLPVRAVERLWAQTGAMDATATRALLEKFRDYSLLEASPNPDALRVVTGLQEMAGNFWIDAPKTHQALLDSYRSTYNLTGWSELPVDDDYIWGRLAYHLSKLGQVDELDALLRDYGWLQARLARSWIEILLRDYRLLTRRQSASQVGDALRLSASILARKPSQLAAQLLGRLYGGRTEIAALLDSTRRSGPEDALLPVFPSLATPDGALAAAFAGIDQPVNDLALSPRGDRALIATDGGLICIDLETGDRTTWPISTVLNAVVVTSSGLVIAAGDDGSLPTWNLDTGQPGPVLRKGQPGQPAVTALALLDAQPRPDLPADTPGSPALLDALRSRSPLLLAGDAAGDAHLFRLTPSGPLDRFHPTPPDLRKIPTPVHSLAFLPDGRQILAISGSKYWAICSLLDGSIINWGSAPGDFDKNPGLAQTIVSLDDNCLLANQEANSSEVLLADQQIKGGVMPVLRLRGAQRPIQTLIGLPAGQILGAGDGLLQAWEANGDPAWAYPLAGTSPHLAQAAGPDGLRAASAAANGLVQVWALERAKGWSGALRGCALALGISLEAGRAAAVMDDGSTVTFELENGRQRVWRETTPAPTSKAAQVIKAAPIPEAPKLAPARLQAAAIAARGFMVALPAPEPGVVIWDPETGQSRRVLLPDLHAFSQAVIDDLGKMAVFTLDSGALSVWDLEKRKPSIHLKKSMKAPSALAISLTGEWFAAGNKSGSVNVWRMSDGMLSYEIRVSGTKQPVEALALSGSGELLLVGKRSTAQVWRGNRRIFAFDLGAPVAALSITPDGALAAAAAGNTVQLLDLETLKVRSWFYADAPIHRVAISPDGQFVAAADLGGAIHLLRTSRPPVQSAA